MPFSNLIGLPLELRQEANRVVNAINATVDAILINVSTLNNDVNDATADITKMNEAMSGDIVLKCTPTALGSSAADIAAAVLADGYFEREVEISLVNAAGEVHTWFNGQLSVAGSETNAGDGTADPTAAKVTLVNGVGTCIFRYLKTWATGDIATLTITGGTILGYTIANKTSVDTLIA